MRHKDDEIINRYNRISKVYDLLESPMESIYMGKWREKLIKRLEEIRRVCKIMGK